MVRIPQYLTRPVELPHGEIGVAMKAEENSRSGSRISDDEPNQSLSIRSLVVHASGFNRRLMQAGWLKENSLLGPPDQQEEPAQQPKNQERANHASTSRGFQWVCMAGNLRQCEFQ